MGLLATSHLQFDRSRETRLILHRRNQRYPDNCGGGQGMGRKKSDAEPYTLEGWTLGRRGDDWVADARKNGTGPRATLGKFKSEDEASAALQRFVEARKMLVKHATEHTIGDLWQLWLKDRAE